MQKLKTRSTNMKPIINFENLEPCKICGERSFRWGHGIHHRDVDGRSIYESVHCEKCSRVHPVMDRLVILKIISIHPYGELDENDTFTNEDGKINTDTIKKMLPEPEIDSCQRPHGELINEYIVVDGDGEVNIELLKEIFPNHEVISCEYNYGIYSIFCISKDGHKALFKLCLEEGEL